VAGYASGPPSAVSVRPARTTSPSATSLSSLARVSGLTFELDRDHLGVVRHRCQRRLAAGAVQRGEGRACVREAALQIGGPLALGTTTPRGLGVSGEGCAVVTGARGGLDLGDADRASWAGRACALAGHNLRRTEWARYARRSWHATCATSG